jgi:molecular chaperone GrpE
MKKAESEIDKIGPQTGELNGPAATEPLMTVEAATITPGQLEELKARAAKADEHWNRLLRSMADFDNFRKRAAREKHEAIKYANDALIEKLIPVLDHFDMAIAAAQNGPADTVPPLQQGISMIYQQFKNTLAEAGLKEIDATGQQFDPNWHEAVAQQETAEAPEGQVIQQLRKGYKLHDRLLRPATVIVAKKPGPHAGSSNS